MQPQTPTNQATVPTPVAPGLTPQVIAAQAFAPTSSYDVAQAANGQAKTGRSKQLKTAAAVLLLAIVFSGGYFANGAVAHASQANANKQAKAFVAALNSGNNTQAYKLASSQLKQQQTESQFLASIGDLKASAPTISDESISFNGRSATYNATEDGLPATADGNTGGIFTVALVKDGLTNWKVNNIQVN